MKKLFLLWMFVCGCLGARAQFGAGDEPEYTPPPTRWKQRADSIFQHLDRSPVGTGLLLNYGFALKDPAPFQGAASSAASLLRGPLEWRMLYMALESSRYNANATLPADSSDAASARLS